MSMAESHRVEKPAPERPGERAGSCRRHDRAVIGNRGERAEDPIPKTAVASMRLGPIFREESEPAGLEF